MLGIPERAVHDRAHAALAVLAPRQARELTAERARRSATTCSASESVAERLAMRTYLSGSDTRSRMGAGDLRRARAAGRRRAARTIPAGPAAPAVRGAPALARTGRGRRQRAGRDPAGRAAGDAVARSLPSSRLGGALLLAAIVVRDRRRGHPADQQRRWLAYQARPPAPSTSAAKTTSTGGPNGRPSALTLHSPDPAKQEHRRRWRCSPKAASTRSTWRPNTSRPSNGFFYAIWLYNSPTSALPLEQEPRRSAPTGACRRRVAARQRGRIHTILLTRETSDHPTHPGPVVLSGPFSLAAADVSPAACPGS